MTHQQLNTTGYIVISEEKRIEPITYRDYLNEYGQDLCTSPNGVTDRLHIRQIKEKSYLNPIINEVISESVYDALPDRMQESYESYHEEVTVRWEIWTWGANGNHPRYEGISFDNKEEAELYYFERSEWYIQEKNWDAPRFCKSFEEGVVEMSNIFDRSEDVIRRYISISLIAARKEAEQKAFVAKKNEERKARLVVEVAEEANSIIIDEEFKSAIKWAEEATGKEKSTRMASALKSLLARNNKEKIDTDFWQVLRVLKSKI